MIPQAAPAQRPCLAGVSGHAFTNDLRCCPRFSLPMAKEHLTPPFHSGMKLHLIFGFILLFAAFFVGVFSWTQEEAAALLEVCTSTKPQGKGWAPGCDVYTQPCSAQGVVCSGNATEGSERISELYSLLLLISAHPAACWTAWA